MTCTEFQNVLPYIIDSDPTAEEHAHLDSCRVCSDVVADLKHIAQSAKHLVSLEEPPARVWHNLRRRLERQELGRAPHSINITQLAQLLKDAATAHHEYELKQGTRDENWPSWYARWILEQLERPGTGNGNGDGHSLAFPHGDNPEYWAAH